MTTEPTLKLHLIGWKMKFWRPTRLRSARSGGFCIDSRPLTGRKQLKATRKDHQ